MRRLFLIALFLALPWMYAAERGVLVTPAIAVAADEAPKAPDAPKAPAVDVNVNRTEKHVISFADPMTLAIGAGVVIVIVALIAMASRSGGTTIVKER
jgi:hypothetical protein